MKDRDEIHFDAILAKNDIAREIRNGGENKELIYELLRDIEKHIGELNQPSVDDILESNLDI